MKMLPYSISFVFALMVAITGSPVHGSSSNEVEKLVQATLDTAGENRVELESALHQIEPEFQPGMRFLIAYMPPSDAQSLSAEFLLEHVRGGYRAWHQSPWKESIQEEMFFNYILPYANVSEKREAWRNDFRKRFLPLVENAKTPGEAAVILNQKVFGMVNVKYSRERRRADQGPFESMETGTASCTGLSILLIDACRAVGVPARFVGVPRWSDNSGNHSWVEVWDGEWKFTGAAEPSGDELNKGWFTGRASGAKRDQPMYAIYAVSYRKTPLKFPLVWKRNFDPVWSVNVTDRYTEAQTELAEGHILARFQVVRNHERDRVAAQLVIRTPEGDTVFEGTTKDESFDGNDHVSVELPEYSDFRVSCRFGDSFHESLIRTGRDNQLFSLRLQKKQSEKPRTPWQDRRSEWSAFDELKKYFATDDASLERLAEQAFAEAPLTKVEAKQVAKLIWEQYCKEQLDERQAELASKVIVQGDLEMKFDTRTFGDKPASGHALFISMHGGGGAPKEVNDQQWRNQIRLYEPKEGIYLAPRAPTDTWNLWHQGHVDGMFDRIIEDFVITGQVDPNRVFLMGYSAGGDGVYQLAPRMADRFAAASMMAGHPNETSAEGLRNLPFMIFMGGKDAAYKRNETARSWKKSLAELHEADQQGYDHLVTIYPEKGHWMDREDAVALEWMSKKTRRVWPKKVVWKQDDVTHNRFYWLSVDEPVQRSVIRAEVVEDKVSISSELAKGKARIWLSDRMVNLDMPVKLDINGQRSVVQANRTIAAMLASLEARNDGEMIASSFVDIIF